MQTLEIDTNSVVKQTRTAGLFAHPSRRHRRGAQRARCDKPRDEEDLELALAKASTTIIWMTGALLAQGALVVALIQYFK
jgi:hypothetical protein